MAEYKRPASEAEFEQNFAPIHPLMNDTQAYYESARCLFCYDAPCINACPTGIDIPLFIRQIHTGNVAGAAKTIYDANTLGYACGKVCPTEVLCEGACVYNEQQVKPIEIGRLQSYATGRVMAENRQLYRPGKPNGKKVAVIGAGPAGIACACELRMYGFEVDIYEAKAQPAGLNLYGVAPYKITNEEALAEVAYLQQQFGFKLLCKRPVRSRADLDELEQTYDAIFLGIGLGGTRSLGIPGEQLANCLGAVEFIEALRMQQHQLQVGRQVVVIGGGNTAMDAASESARMGAESVILAYRRSKEEMGAYPFEYELAKSVGVRALFNVSPVEILGKEQVEGVRFVRTRSHKGELEIVPGSEFIQPCDMLIRATGQSKHSALLQLIEGLELDAKGRICVNERFQTGNARYFAAGDAVNGGVEVVNAVAEARRAARGILEAVAPD
ncbi:MAG: hypothetical protein D6730_03215 [Bacteroidetes bacterium]|nr:MAG: hypothetical protein D6730_03215 [Bacteroidota bacterium]